MQNFELEKDEQNKVHIPNLNPKMVENLIGEDSLTQINFCLVLDRNTADVRCIWTNRQIMYQVAEGNLDGLNLKEDEAIFRKGKMYFSHTFRKKDREIGYAVSRLYIDGSLEDLEYYTPFMIESMSDELLPAVDNNGERNIELGFNLDLNGNLI